MDWIDCDCLGNDCEKEKQDSIQEQERLVIDWIDEDRRWTGRAGRPEVFNTHSNLEADSHEKVNAAHMRSGWFHSHEQEQVQCCEV